MQSWLVANLVLDTSKFMFCGDVIRSLETNQHKLESLFKDKGKYSVTSFNTRWEDQINNETLFKEIQDKLFQGEERAVPMVILFQKIQFLRDLAIVEYGSNHSDSIARVTCSAPFSSLND